MSEWTSNQWLGIVVVAVVGMVIIGILFVVALRRGKNNAKQLAPRTKGVNDAVKIARRFARSNSYRVIAPATLVRGGKTAELDAIVVGFFGVLGIKALGYNGEVYGNPSEKEWLQVSAKGERRNFANPMMEATADVRVIRDALFANKQKLVPVEVIVVFTDAKAQLALPRSTGHLKLKELKSYLSKEKYREDKGIDLDAVEKALRAALAEDQPA